MLHCFSHALWSLLFSFSYRYYILSHYLPKPRTVAAIIAVMYLPSAFQFVSFCFAGDSADDVKAVIAEKFNYNLNDECVSGVLDIVRWNALFTIFHMTLPVIPIYVAILILRRATVIKLSSLRTVSDSYRELHSNLLKALTYYACLPIFFLVASITYSINQLNILKNPILEYSVVVVDVIPMLSPLTSLRFVGPYRDWICDNILRRLSKTRIPLESRIWSKQ
ncbi:unnamed protein product [Heligmosomoides polygyrus]|uniref:G protein-coupled receptor n=1 Tax=Heligmosomoides polygyrus TaxID=6339 RepID=A0A183G9K6_HELPZ|nr:unnamed protein product [Heligmosomoides polygyrus]